ncbi:MAG TPA: hypothetical protein VH196_11070 [Terriglobales bacterium]|nr:hypothetical protein [Terriglobales bacterium]
MRSTKFYSATMVLGLVFALTATLAAQDGKKSFDGGIGMYDACQPIANFAAQGCTSVLTSGPACYQSIVWVPGSTEVNFHKNGKHASVHVLFHNAGQQYQVNLEANQQFDQVASDYFVPFHSVFVSLNGGSNFKMDGTLDIAVDANGTPKSSNLMLFDANYPLTLACSQ